MYIVPGYFTAVIFTFITMLCWGSWANTQKMAAKSWRFELFYWDYVIGIVLFSILSAFTLGSTGVEGRSFLSDLQQADFNNLMKAFLGGVVFNMANILLVAAIAITGMSVAFPVGIGIALILGVVVNYIGSPKGDPVFLFAGVGLVVVAIILDALAYKKNSSKARKLTLRGILLSLIAGILMSFFYRFIAASMAEDFSFPTAGKLTPYSAVFVFSLGILISNFLFNTVFMKRPVEGTPVSYKMYFNGNFKTHLTGVFGGLIWSLGMSLNIIAAGEAGYAISYGLGQGATLVGALWGVFIWKEFRGAGKGVNAMLALMFLFFLAGITLIIMAGV